jgi:hypothetical protein
MNWSKEKVKEINETSFEIKFPSNGSEPIVKIFGTPDGFATKMAYTLIKGYEIGVLDKDHIEMVAQLIKTETANMKKNPTDVITVEDDEIYIGKKKLDPEKGQKLMEILKDIIEDEEGEE